MTYECECGRSFTHGGPFAQHHADCQAPVYCPCLTSDFDAIGQCRRCRLADLRAPQFAESRARLDAALAVPSP